MILFLVLLYVILFVPKNADDLLAFGRIKLQDTKTYHIHMTVNESVIVSSEEIGALKQFGMKEAEIPVKWEKDIYHNEEQELITSSCTYRFEGKEGAFEQGSLQKDGIEYLLREAQPEAAPSGEAIPAAAGTADSAAQNEQAKDGEAIPADAGTADSAASYEPMQDGEAVPPALSSIDPVELLEVKHAKMRRLFGNYRMTVDSANAEAMIEEVLGIKPAKGSRITFVFDRMSHMLQSIKGEKIIAEGRAIDFSIQIDDEEEAVNKALSEVAVTETPEAQETPADKYRLTTEDLEKTGKDCYVAGKDFPAGTYTASPRKGRGIILGVSGVDGREIFRYNYGYDYFRIDTIDKKETRTWKLAEGSRIFLSGKDMVVELKKAKKGDQ